MKRVAGLFAIICPKHLMNIHHNRSRIAQRLPLCVVVLMDDTVLFIFFKLCIY